MKIAIGADNLAVELKEVVKELLSEKKIEYKDFGVFNNDPVDYPDIAKVVAENVASHEFDRGILICGTGIGMAIAANKVEGIRAAVCHDIYSAERARKSNNAQIMALGAFIVGKALARSLVTTWLESEFQGGGSEQKVNKIMEIEKEKMALS